MFRGFERLPDFCNPVCTLGSYDGVHIGHKYLIQRCVDIAKSIGGESVVLTFEPHPRIVLGRAEGLRLLTTIDEKIELLTRAGVDNLIIIPFDEPFSKLPYNEFVESFLVGKIGVHTFVLGYNHLFGHKNEGNHSVLNLMSQDLGFEVVELAEMRSSDAKVSSTVIRKTIELGDIEQANLYLGHPYLINVGDIEDRMKLLPVAGKYLAEMDGRELKVEFSEERGLLCDIDISNKKISIIRKL